MYVYHSRNVQNAFWSGYKHHYIFNWYSFPWVDGLFTLDGPSPGLYTGHFEDMEVDELARTTDLGQ